jgi:hypothetical protein
MTRYGDEIFPFGYAEVDLRRAERKRSIITLEQPLTFLKVLAGKLLKDVFGILAVACEPTRQVVSGVKCNNTACSKV